MIKFKQCTSCNITYPATLGYFYQDQRGSDKLISECRTCFGLRVKRYSQTDKGKEVKCKAIKRYNQSEKGKVAQRRWALKNNYGISLDE